MKLTLNQLAGTARAVIGPFELAGTHLISDPAECPDSESICLSFGSRIYKESYALFAAVTQVLATKFSFASLQYRQAEEPGTSRPKASLASPPAA